MARQIILTDKEWVVLPKTTFISEREGWQGAKYEYTNPHQATFHTFSQESEEVEGGSLHHPVAIVELTDGTVQTVSLDRIRFVNPI